MAQLPTVRRFSGMSGARRQDTPRSRASPIAYLGESGEIKPSVGLC